MLKQTLMMSALSGALMLASGFALAADQERIPDAAQKQKQMYGSELMTQQERIEYRSRMRDAKTPEKRQQVRLEHHEGMKERAKQRGVALPDEPPARGGGLGPDGGGNR
jgi:hypothetical protein